MKRPAAICRRSPQLAADRRNVRQPDALPVILRSGTLMETVQMIQEQAETILDLCADLRTDMEGIT